MQVQKFNKSGHTQHESKINRKQDYGMNMKRLESAGNNERKGELHNHALSNGANHA